MQVMQGHPVPYFAFLHLGRQGIADFCKSRLQSQQTLELLGRCVEWYADDGIHIGSEYSRSYMNISSPFEKIFKCL
jgi:hypothetical protein